MGKKRRDGDLCDAGLAGKAQKIADRILVVQVRCAAKLHVLAARLGQFWTKLLLVVLGMGFGCYCLWLLRSAFS